MRVRLSARPFHRARHRPIKAIGLQSAAIRSQPGQRPLRLRRRANFLSRMAEHRAVPCAPNEDFLRCSYYSGVELRWAHRLQVCVPFIPPQPAF